MSDDDGLLVMVSILCLALWAQVVRLNRRVESLEEDAELATVAAGSPGSLLDAKKALEKWRDDRAVERSRI